MAWPIRLYLATTNLGIFWTPEFSALGAQPVYDTLNTGLSNLDIASFCLDRHETIADQRMLCIDGTTRTLWIRESGDWASLLTSAAAQALVGVGAGSLLRTCIDKITGYIYVLFLDDLSSPHYVLRSIDHGENWTVHTVLGINVSGSHSNIDAHNGVVAWTGEPALSERLYVSADHGVTWTMVTVSHNGYVANIAVHVHRSGSGIVLGNCWPSAQGPYLFRYDTVGAGLTYPFPATKVGPAKPGALYTYANDANQLAVINGTFGHSSDDCTTLDVLETLDVVGQTQLVDGCDPDFWIHLGPAVPNAPGPFAPLYISTDGYTFTDRSGDGWAANTPGSLIANIDDFTRGGGWGVLNPRARIFVGHVLFE